VEREFGRAIIIGRGVAAGASKQAVNYESGSQSTFGGFKRPIITASIKFLLFPFIKAIFTVTESK
jgi:hypothetical protein